MSIVIVILLLLTVGAGTGVVLFARGASEAQAKVKQLQSASEALQQQLATAQGQVMTARHQLAQAQSAFAQTGTFSQEIQRLTEELKEKESQLTEAEHAVEWHRAELEKRPKAVRKTYKILTLGMKATGKTSLTLKWSNPLVDLGTIQGTKIERYERTVSTVVLNGVSTEHVFEIGDWGGEHIVDAQQELIMEEIHGLLVVVDLGGKDAKAVQPERIQEQLREFQPQSLKYFFGAKTVASCKTVVIFINKADLLPGTPAEAESRALDLYGKLIKDLELYKEKVDIRVLVGSASYGHSTHHLFSHFVEKILPKNAYDNQLLQRMKEDLKAPTPNKPRGPKGT